MKSKFKRIILGIAALAALALGGSALAGAADDGTEAGKPPAAERAESEADRSLEGADADRARTAAEQATGGKAGEVERDNVDSEEDEAADDDGGAQEGYQSPANAAYEVEVDRGGKEVEVYLDSNFQVLDTQVDDEDEQE
ncbi:MAG: hypothetical protein QOJ22_946 [Thermoleophilaceae bacterium]|nr:hypothetical protein [Thermoleophilaceae bacterium]